MQRKHSFSVQSVTINLSFGIARQSGHKDLRQDQAGSEDPEAAVQGDL